MGHLLSSMESNDQSDKGAYSYEHHSFGPFTDEKEQANRN